MNKIQYIELLKLRGVHELVGETLGMAVKRTGGDPTKDEMIIVNEMAMKYYIGKYQESEQLLKQAKERIVSLESNIDEMIEDSTWLSYLEAAGVDNWEGYDIAADMMRKDNPEEDEE